MIYQVTRAASPHGWLLAQLVAADRLTVEFVLASAPRPSGLTSAAQEYVR